MKKFNGLMVAGFLSTVILTGCSDNEDDASKVPAAGQEQTAEEETVVEKKVAETETAEAAVHNVEEIVKEKGKYNIQQMTDQQKEELQAELEAAPEGMSGEEAYSFAVSLVAVDIEEAAEKFEAIDPVITMDSSTPEDSITLPQEETVNVAILLDASGSMAGQVSGGEKMKLAKEAVQTYAADLPEGSNVMLRVYGHEGTGTNADKDMSCNSNEVVYDLGVYDEQAFSKSLDQFAPTGWTPLAGAIEAAKEDLKEQKGENVRNVVYVVSDGIETCGGDPVSAAASLTGSAIQAEVNIIGFDVDNEGQAQLEAVAKAGNGQYKSVYSESDLNEYLKQEHSRLYWEWLAWGNDRYLEILQQSNDIAGDLLSYNNEIYGKSLAENNKMNRLQDELEEFGKFKDKEAADQYNKLATTRHETLTQYFRQEKERKDTIRKDIYEQLEKKVKETSEEKEGDYAS
ncbi:vWA domain-containing protein [Planococcus sp. 4-30]|uniref:vWA domain-containing protein n=1 Tax=Planococcus sp. 4-30 TaxID=2874583 RepID=UPI001CBC3726|nr:VWA domain-containing protein [Planococcus sp. 4-30]